MVGFKTIKTGYSAYKGVKAGIDAVCHPLQWAKDQLVGGLKGVLLATLAKTFGESAARAAVEKLDLEGKTYPLKVSVPLHEKLQKVVSNPEHVSFVQEVVNDALAIPLQALGYRLAEVDFNCTEGALNLELQLGLQRLVPVVVLENKAPEEHQALNNGSSEFQQKPGVAMKTQHAEK